MLAAGLAGRGTMVTVAGPSSADARFGFASLAGVTFVPVEFAVRPRAGDLAAIARLRRTLTGVRLVHAHGLRAGALTVLALAGRRGASRRGASLRGAGVGRGGAGAGRLSLVVTVHNAPPAGRAGALIYRLLEQIVARSADLILCVSPDLERRMRAAGARRIGRAVVAAPQRRTAEPQATEPPAAHGPAGLPPDRPLVLAVGRLAPQKGFATLLEAAATWQDLRPTPLLAIAGDGPLAGSLRATAAPLGEGVRFLGQRDDVPALLAAARVFVLPSRWEGQPLVLQQALRAGTAIVATRTGGIPALTGDDAALLVQPGDAAALAAAVREVLGDQALASRLRAAAREAAATLPSENDAIEAALASYATAALALSRRQARRFLRDT
ncbi:glycosyltransferase [Trebonia kvetii]|uniref:Glycosyltransferase n=2 Tax=Trebonia kvetii TaxID=2480626 RepID=A0A6P2BMX7_9ACTN|nr:glycosyltransferase [Trebonia kvetii]